ATSPDARIARAFELVVSRPPTPMEVARLSKLYEAELAATNAVGARASRPPSTEPAGETQPSPETTTGSPPALPPEHPALHARLGAVTRRHFLRTCSTGLGAMWLAATAQGAAQKLGFTRPAAEPLAPLPPQYAARAKRVIYLHMAGAPSQLELFDYKPDLQRLDGQDCPSSFLEGKRFAFISGVPKMLGPQFPFHRAGKSGT